MPRREAIFDQLEAEPVDRESWTVYADLLLERADPWAQIVLDALSGRSPVARMQAARERRDPVYWPRELLDWSYTPPVLSWRMGLWRELELVLPVISRREADALARIVTHPAARLLHRLRLRCSGMVTQDRLEAFAPLEVPLALDLAHTRSTDLSALARLPSLRELRLGRSHRGALPELPQLESFAAEYQHTPEDLWWLARCGALRELGIALEGTTRLNLSALGALPLVSLTLSVQLLGTRPDWDSIARCASLSRLQIEGAVEGTVLGLRGLAPLPALRHLELRHLRSALWAVPDAVCERLTGLAVVGEDTNIGRNLARCLAVEELHLGLAQVSHGPLAALPKLRSLRLSELQAPPELDGLALDRVELRQSNPPQGTVDAIGRMGSLRELSFDGELYPKERARLHRLRSLPGLEVLDLHRCEDVPAALRWRFEGKEEVGLAFEALARG
jgi:hypothetical protein